MVTGPPANPCTHPDSIPMAHVFVSIVSLCSCSECAFRSQCIRIPLPVPLINNWSGAPRTSYRVEVTSHKGSHMASSHCWAVLVLTIIYNYVVLFVFFKHASLPKVHTEVLSSCKPQVFTALVSLKPCCILPIETKYIIRVSVQAFVLVTYYPFTPQIVHCNLQSTNVGNLACSDEWCQLTMGLIGDGIDWGWM